MLEAGGLARTGPAGSALAFLVQLALLLALLVACVPPALPSSSPKRPDIQRAKIDIAFSGLIGSSYYRPNGRDLLTAALDAIKKEARDAGGRDDVATPPFDGSEERQLEDFRRFATAAEELAAKNPRLAPSRIGTAAIRAMLRVNPDCHNYFVPGAGGAALLARPLEESAGLQTRMLAGGIAYIGWRSFMDPAVFDDVRKALDRLLTDGAKAWLFDLQNNGGGEGPQVMVSWFVDGGTIWREVDREGKHTPAEAKREFLLPARYQLPIAIAVNGRTGSAPEFFTVALQQRGRAKVFGQRTSGCLGSTALAPLSDGSLISITQSVVIGPISDAPVNNVGIVPDVPVSGDPVEAAASYLRSLTTR